jgi:hypothetical protein
MNYLTCRWKRCASRTTAGLLVATAAGFTGTVARADNSTIREVVIQEIIATQTGGPAEQTRRPVAVAETGITIGVGRDAETGKELTSFAQARGRTSRMMSVIESRGSDSIDFPLSVPAGARVALRGNVGSVVKQVGEDSVAILASIDPPWAIDAGGRRLPTSYTYSDGVLTQHVDTSEARFPVVTDPSIRTGFYIVPVFYVQYTWTETWWVKNHLPQSAIATALLCSQTGAAAPFCGYYGALFLNDVRVTTDAAIANRKCLKMRLPATLGAVGLPAYDSYYVTCTS